MGFRVLKYHEAKQKIIQFIKKSSVPIGGKLPTERELASALDMSICPIRRAMEELQASGIVRRMAGSGTFYEGHLDCLDHDSVCGLVCIGHDRYPQSYELSHLRNYVVGQNADYHFCSVQGIPKPTILDELSCCDRLMVMGCMTKEWFEILSALGKPMIQVGISDYDSCLSKVWYDIKGAMRLLLRRFSTAQHFGALLSDCSEVCYGEIQLGILADALEDRYDSSRICFLKEKDDYLPSIKKFMMESYSSCDVLLVEERYFVPLLLVSSFFPRTLDVPIVVLCGTECLIPQGFESLPNLYCIYFPETILSTAAKILYEYPYSFLEQGKEYLLKPRLIGSGEKVC